MTDASTATLAELEQKAREIRLAVLDMAARARTPHIASAFSIVEILVALYYRVMSVSPERPDDPGRDRFVLSKGHGCMALYACLADRGFFPEQMLSEYAVDGGRLAEHPSSKTTPGVEFSTGSLGHGLSVGTGIALALRCDAPGARVFVVCSDGEMDSGTVWEAALFAAAHKLERLTVIVDRNRFQATGQTEQIMPLEPLALKWRHFGWAVTELDGHDFGALVAAVGNTPAEPGKPHAVIARTIKGKGVSFMENNLVWHYRPPDADEAARAREEILRA